jgi:hypothetical protein
MRYALLADYIPKIGNQFIRFNSEFSFSLVVEKNRGREEATTQGLSGLRNSPHFSSISGCNKFRLLLLHIDTSTGFYLFASNLFAISENVFVNS